MRTCRETRGYDSHGRPHVLHSACQEKLVNAQLGYHREARLKADLLPKTVQLSLVHAMPVGFVGALHPATETQIRRGGEVLLLSWEALEHALVGRPVPALQTSQVKCLRSEEQKSVPILSSSAR